MKLIHFEQCASTNTEAWQILETAGEPVLVTADRQTSGRGRHGRKWIDSAPENIKASLAIPLNWKGDELSRLSWVTAIAGVVAIETLTQAIDADFPDLHLKWPNDIYYAHSKLAGILSESKISGEGNYAKCNGIVIGMGMNLIDAPVHADLANEPVIYQAISLRELPLVGELDFSFLKKDIAVNWAQDLIAIFSDWTETKAHDFSERWLSHAHLDRFVETQEARTERETLFKSLLS